MTRLAKTDEQIREIITSKFRHARDYAEREGFMLSTVCLPPDQANIVIAALTMTHSPMSQNRVRDALEPTDKQIEAAAEAILARRGFGFYTDPMEGGQDAYDISVEALDEAAHALKAALTAPPASDAAGAEGLAGTWLVDFLREAFDEGVNAASTYDRNPKEKRWSDYANEAFNAFWLEEQDRLAAAPTAPAQAPSRPVDAGGVEARDALIERLNRVAKNSWTGSVEEWTVQAVLAMCAASRYLAALAPQSTGTEAGRPVGGEDYSDLTWDSPIELPAEAGRGLAGQIMDAAWPEFGGNNLPADFWHAFSLAVRFTLAAAPTEPAQAPSRPVDAGGVEAALGTDEPDLASDIACAVMCLPWARGGDADEHGDRYGQIQEIADPLIRAALATQAPDKAGARKGLSEEHHADLVSLRNHLESEGHIHDADAISAALKALATQPTGTEASRAVGAEAVEALKPFVKHYDPRWMDAWADKDECTSHSRVTFGDLRRARNLVLAANGATPPQADSTGQGDAIKEAAGRVFARLCEFDDRTSPEEYPDMVLVTADELAWLMEEELATPSQADAQTQEGGE